MTSEALIPPDPYARSAEFIDIMIAPWWEQVGHHVAAALQGIGPVENPIVDIGAGSGLGVRVIAAAMPAVEVFAVEPSPALRAVLLARVAADEDLRQRVTVLPLGLPAAPLPDRFGALTALNMLGHLHPDDRRGLWALLDERLDPAGRAVLNLQPPATPVVVDKTRFSCVAVGRHRYDGWGRAEPAGPGRVVWTMTYRTLADGVLVDEREVSYDWWTLSEDQLYEEVAGHGLRADPHGPADLGLYVLRHV